MSWLGGYNKRRAIYIDNSKVSENLTNFPTLLRIRSDAGIGSNDVTDVFDEIGADYKKIAVTTDDGSTQCYVEVDKWDSVNERAWLWVKVPTVSKDVDTLLYLYFDQYADDNDDYVSSVSERVADMVIDVGDEGTYDIDDIYGADVIQFNDVYDAWYTGFDGSNYRLIYCSSTDGYVWTSHQLAVDISSEGTYDSDRSGFCSVLKVGSTYKMWYSGYDGSNWRIIYCDSTDKINWSNHQLVVNLSDEGTYDTDHARSPSVILDAGNTYKMWYSGHDGSNWRIIYCDSTDGLNWSNHQMVLNIGALGGYDDAHVYMPSVIKDGGTYRMWYTGHSGSFYRIIYCDSTDGLVWINHYVVSGPCWEGAQDDQYIYNPMVIKSRVGTGGKDKFKIWYAGYDGSTWRLFHSQDASVLPHQRVWGTDYKAVYHFNSESGDYSIRDSTGANSGYPYGFTSSSYQDHDEYGSELYFSRDSSEWVQLPNDESFWDNIYDYGEGVEIEFVARRGSNNNEVIFTMETYWGDSTKNVDISIGTNLYINYQVCFSDTDQYVGASPYQWPSGDYTNYYYGSFRMEDRYFYGRFNNNWITQKTNPSNSSFNYDTCRIGIRGSSYPYHGDMAEFRYKRGYLGSQQALVAANDYTYFDNFVTWSGTTITGSLYYFSGYTKEQDVAVGPRTVYFYKRDTGEYMTTATSSPADGSFTAYTTWSGAHFGICVDTASGIRYNDLIIGDIIPEIV